MDEFIYREESYRIIGILMEVHRNLGKGFSEIVYKDAIEYELTQNQISFEREKEYTVKYKNSILKHKFYADFVIENKNYFRSQNSFLFQRKSLQSMPELSDDFRK